MGIKNYDPASTESNIMHDRGSYKIWGCEQVKWVYER